MNMYKPPHTQADLIMQPMLLYAVDSWPGQRMDGNYTLSISISRGLKCMRVCLCVCVLSGLPPDSFSIYNVHGGFTLVVPLNL